MHLSVLDPVEESVSFPDTILVRNLARILVKILPFGKPTLLPTRLPFLKLFLRYENTPPRCASPPAQCGPMSASL